VEQLEDRKVSLARIEQLLGDLRAESATTEQFLARNSDLADGPIGWLARISLGTLLAVLALVFTVYSSERSARTAEEQLRVAEEQVELQRDALRGEAQALTPEDVQRIARRLHELQQEVQIKPPPKPPPRKHRP
jgi:hypothetical protein